MRFIARICRRRILQRGSAVTFFGFWAMLGRTGWVRAAGEPAARAAFESHSITAALQALGLGAPADSDAVSVSGPDVAENGAVVPFTIASTAPDTRQLLLMVEKNPSPLAAAFTLTPAVEPSVATRVKMGESSAVYAVAVIADGRVLAARKDVRVVLGGCGG